MKRLLQFVIIIILCMVQTKGFAEPLDSNNKKAIDTIKKKIDTIQHAIDTVKLKMVASIKPDSANCKCRPLYDVNKEVEGTGKWFLILLPFYLLILVLVFVISISGKFEIKEALTENDKPKKTIKNDEYSASNFEKLQTVPNVAALLPPTVEVTEGVNTLITTDNVLLKNYDTSNTLYRPSISRYIALITSLITIIIVVCMSSFFIYHYMRTGCPPDFGALTTALIALGVGVIPYITNKISTAAASNKLNS